MVDLDGQPELHSRTVRRAMMPAMLVRGLAVQLVFGAAGTEASVTDADDSLRCGPGLSPSESYDAAVRGGDMRRRVDQSAVVPVAAAAPGISW